MPDQVPSLDAVDEEQEARLIAAARADIAAGSGIPHDQVKAWLAKLVQGERTPPPTR